MFFDEVGEAQADAIFGLLAAFNADPRKEKINLTVGIYKDDRLRAELLSSVKRGRDAVVRQELVADYLPIDGLKELIEGVGPLLFGTGAWEKGSERIYGAHTPGGTGALRVGAEFLAQEVSKNCYIPNPTWPNHRSIFEQAGFKVESYPYYNREKKIFDFEAVVDFLSKLPPKSVVLFHACCHNPTGCDPTVEQWKSLSQIVKEKRLFPFFDCAYQGLGEGLEKDVESVRLFLADGHEMAIGYSCSKNFSMYCQRVGTLFVVCENKTAALKVGSQVKQLIRAIYSNPPAHGAKIVVEVLKDRELHKIWTKDLEEIRHRLNLMREALIQRLISKTKKLDFEYLKTHKGMFSFIDLNKSQVERLSQQYAIYITDNGRISVAGLTTKNIDYVVNSLIAVSHA